MSTCVCVLSNSGERLMPTIRLGKVRRLLKDGKAKIIKHHPFTIQLLYDSKANTQSIEICEDVGYNYIGYSMRNGHYEVTDAIPMDEDYDEDSGNEEDDESEEWEQHNRREVRDFHPIMEFLHSADEQLLREDIRRYDIKTAVIRTKEEMHEFYRTQPDEMILAALVEVDDKVSGKHYCSIRVWCSGHEIKTRSMGSYYVLNKHYLTVNKDDMVATYPYPFSCDDGANTLLETKDTDILTPVERLFLWTEYKNPNPIETKKNKESLP